MIRRNEDCWLLCLPQQRLGNFCTRSEQALTIPDLPAVAPFQFWLWLNWFFGPGLDCPKCLDKRPSCLASVVHRPCTFLFSQVFPSSVLRSDLLYLVSQGLCMTIQAPTDAEDPFSWDDAQLYLTLGWKLVEMHASMCCLWVFRSWGLNISVSTSPLLLKISTSTAPPKLLFGNFRFVPQSWPPGLELP